MLRLLSRRSLHSAGSTNPFLYTTTYSDLQAKINQYVTNAANVSDDLALQALSACKDLASQERGTHNSGGKRLNSQIEKILGDEKVTLSLESLRQVLLLRLPASANVKILELALKRNPSLVIPKATALIPLRFSLFDADVENAVKITDLTTGHANYVAEKGKILRNGVYKLAATAIGITLFSKVGVKAVIDMGWLGPAWKHLSSINAMIITYLLNSSFFVTIVKFGRQLLSAGGDVLTWQKGTFYTHWYKHADEMSFCTRIMETDKKLNGGFDNSASLVEDLCRTSENNDGKHTLQPGWTRDGKKVRLLAPKDNIEDLKMQAYWMSGGDGFEWVEPDQDPADLVWRQHLEAMKKPLLTTSDQKSLNWAEDLIEEEKQNK